MTDTRPLSERLAEIADLPAIVVALTPERRIAIAEAVALAARVEAAPVADVSRHAHIGPLVLVDSDALVGKRVALVEVGDD